MSDERLKTAHIQYLRTLAKDQEDLGNEALSGALGSAADALEAFEAKRIDLEAKLANAERRADDAESRNDFLLSEIDEIIKRERQRT